MSASDDSKDFDKWFDEQEFSEEYRYVFATIWDSAIESAKNEIGDEWRWALESLTSND